MNFNLLTLAAEASGAAGSGAGGSLMMIGMLVLMFGLMYFIIIRPQKKKEKD